MKIHISNTTELKTFILNNDLSNKQIQELIYKTLGLLLINEYSNSEIVELITSFENRVNSNCKGIFLDKDPLYEKIIVKDFINSLF